MKPVFRIGHTHLAGDIKTYGSHRRVVADAHACTLGKVQAVKFVKGISRIIKYGCTPVLADGPFQFDTPHQQVLSSDDLTMGIFSPQRLVGIPPDTVVAACEKPKRNGNVQEISI